MACAAHTCGLTVSALELGDVGEFVRLQDLFAEEHLLLTRPIYEQVELRDWQLGLLCPARILDEPGGRERHAESMVRRNEDCFQKLFILKVMEQLNGAPPTMAGYIMFQVHEEAVKKKSRGGGRAGRGSRATNAPLGPWAQVKQIFVRKELRGKGCGKLLFNTMIEALGPEECGELRLTVLDLNEAATGWYRRMGFVVANLSREQIGHKDQLHVIVYQEMRRLSGAKRGEMLLVPLLFRQEVIDEVITIDYPDDSGVFTVRITGYDERNRWHEVDSAGLSIWDGETFTDVVNVNEYFRDGHITFQRQLSLIYRGAELAKRELKRQKALEQTEFEMKKRRLY